MMETASHQQPNTPQIRTEDSVVAVYRHELAEPLIAVYVYPAWLDLENHLHSATILSSLKIPDLDSYTLNQGVEQLFAEKGLTPNKDLIPLADMDIDCKGAYQHQFSVDLEERLVYFLSS